MLNNILYRNVPSTDYSIKSDSGTRTSHSEPEGKLYFENDVQKECQICFGDARSGEVIKSRSGIYAHKDCLEDAMGEECRICFEGFSSGILTKDETGAYVHAKCLKISDDYDSRCFSLFLRTREEPYHGTIALNVAHRKYKNLVSEAFIVRYIMEASLTRSRLPNIEFAHAEEELEFNKHVVEKMRDVYAEENTEEAQALVRMASTYGKLEDTKKQLKCLNEALQIHNRIHGVVDYDVQRILMLIADIHMQMNNAEKMHSALEKATNVMKRLLGKDSDRYGMFLILTSTYYETVGDHQKRIKLLMIASDICEKTYGKDHCNTALANVHLGNAYGALKKYYKQKELQEKAIKVITQSLRWCLDDMNYQPPVKLDDQPLRCENCSFLNEPHASACWMCSAPFPVDRKNEHVALQIWKAIKGGGDWKSLEHKTVSEEELYLAFESLGNAYENLEDYMRQFDYHIQAMEISQIIHGKNDPRVATMLFQMAHAAGCAPEGRGNMLRRELCERALRIRLNNHQEKDDDSVAEAMTRLAGACSKCGDSTMQQTMLKQALEYRERMNGPYHEKVADTLSHIVTVYQKQKNREKQISTLKQLLSLRKNLNGSDSEEYCEVCLQLGKLYDIIGKYELAKEMLTDAFRIERLLSEGEDNARVARVMISIGNIEGKLGNYVLKCSLHATALEIYKSIYPKDDPELKHLTKMLSKTWDTSGLMK